MPSFIHLLIFIIVLGALYWCAMKFCGAVGFPAPITVLVQILFVLAFVGYILNDFGIIHLSLPH